MWENVKNRWKGEKPKTSLNNIVKHIIPKLKLFFNSNRFGELEKKG
jgi:hypothetical protein